MQPYATGLDDDLHSKQDRCFLTHCMYCVQMSKPVCFEGSLSGDMMIEGEMCHPRTFYKVHLAHSSETCVGWHSQDQG